jgi:hypothetical protein
MIRRGSSRRRPSTGCAPGPGTSSRCNSAGPRSRWTPIRSSRGTRGTRWRWARRRAKRCTCPARNRGIGSTTRCSDKRRPSHCTVAASRTCRPAGHRTGRRNIGRLRCTSLRPACTSAPRRRCRPGIARGRNRVGRCGTARPARRKPVGGHRSIRRDPPGATQNRCASHRHYRGRRPDRGARSHRRAARPRRRTGHGRSPPRSSARRSVERPGGRPVPSRPSVDSSGDRCKLANRNTAE